MIFTRVVFCFSEQNVLILGVGNGTASLEPGLLCTRDYFSLLQDYIYVLFATQSFFPVFSIQINGVISE